MQKYTVGGMTCAACSANVERAVRKVEGVKSVSVNLLAGSMQVEGDAVASKVVEAVVKAGYTASVAGGKPQKETPKNDETLSMKKRLVSSIIILVVLMYISMGHMTGLPLPSFMHGSGNQITFAFTQLILALAVALINHAFFTRGFKALVHLSPNMDSLIAVGSASAYIYGIAAIYAIGYGYGHGIPELVDKYSSQLYFESGAMILTLITIGKYL
ncbi:MAG: cation transporter, partial [Clostridia bacterium]|nr:cation transporter [Clostridia bacterium]